MNIYIYIYIHSVVAPRTKRRRPGGVERGWDSVVAPRSKRGGQEVWRGAGTQWSHLEQRGATRRCGEGLGLSGRA